MFKIAGNKKYRFGVISPNDPAQVGLGFNCRFAAERHANAVNESLKNFESDPLWDKSYWKTKPEPYIIFEVEK